MSSDRWTMTPSEVLALPQVPKHLVIIGSTQAAIDLAKKSASSGSVVTILEAAPDLVAAADSKAAMALASDLTRAGVKVRTGVKVTGVSDLGEAVAVDYHEGLNAAARIFADAVVSDPDAG